MDEPNPAPQNHLDYRPPRDDAPAAASHVAAAVVGGIMTCLALWGTVFVWIVSNLSLRGRPQPIEWVFPSIVTVAAIVFVGGMLWGAWRRGNRTAFAGILVGLGAGLLTEGICFSGVLF